MRIVAALGGNALLERGETADSEIQQAHVVEAAAALASIAAGNEMVITHGNGPQVGMLALESAADPALSHPYPLDVLGAQTQGMIGYLLAQALQNALPERLMAGLISRTLVAADDPAFAAPTKFIGPVYDELQARKVAAARGWAMRADGSGWRRVVPSPEPADIVELPIILELVAAGAIVICAGGGGIPVIRDKDGCYSGADAVVDKDLTSAMLAQQIGAEFLLLLTDVAAVQEGYGTAAARPLRHLTVAESGALSFPAGSMGPKIEAARRFAAATGKPAAIGLLADAAALLSGAAGTMITP